MRPLRPVFAFASLLCAIACAATLAGCATIAVATAPNKVAARDESPASKAADAEFWETLHRGRYDRIGDALNGLEAAYLEHPTDARNAAHIGFLHIWRIAESARQEQLAATITDDMLLSRRYFEEAVKLDPKDSRFLGFLAGTTLAEGKIQGDEKLTRKGFFEMKDAVSAWPEFNLFTRGYTMSRLPVTDERFAAAVEDQWDTLDRCADGVRVDRKTADFAPFMSKETRTGWKRPCWNSWIAPHNFEGFFLSMGDMVVKQGDVATARNVYAQARLAKEYPTWPYREVLDRRIAEADLNVARFRAPARNEKERRMMIESTFSCMGCHQE